jgi:hypothetical protein
MFRRLIAVISVLGLAVGASVALASSRPSGTYRATISRPVRLRGVWDINFAAGRDTVIHNGRVEDRGHYTISGSTLTFEPKRACHLPGKYELHLIRNTLRFSEISDPCPSVRPEILRHTFTKVR